MASASPSTPSGGDRAPAEIVAGAVAAATPTSTSVLFGPAALETHGLEHRRAPDPIEMDDKPADAVRAKPDSSLVRAVRAVGDGDADAVVSAGNTGADARGRPAPHPQAARRPSPGHRGRDPDASRGRRVLIDAGANADARPEHLLQFAYMGAVFAEEMLGIDEPRVRLLSIGEEPEKGNQLTLEAHALLAASAAPLRGQHRRPRAARRATPT